MNVIPMLFLMLGSFILAYNWKADGLHSGFLIRSFITTSLKDLGTSPMLREELVIFRRDLITSGIFEVCW